MSGASASAAHPVHGRHLDVNTVGGTVVLAGSNSSSIGNTTLTGAPCNS